MKIEAKSNKELIDEFIEGSDHWYESLLDSFKERDYCAMCGIPPSYLVQLAVAVREQRDLLAKQQTRSTT